MNSITKIEERWQRNSNAMPPCGREFYKAAVAPNFLNFIYIIQICKGYSLILWGVVLLDSSFPQYQANLIFFNKDGNRYKYHC